MLHNALVVFLYACLYVHSDFFGATIKNIKGGRAAISILRAFRRACLSRYATAALFFKLLVRWPLWMVLAVSRSLNFYIEFVRNPEIEIEIGKGSK